MDLVYFQRRLISKCQFNLSTVEANLFYFFKDLFILKKAGVGGGEREGESIFSSARCRAPCGAGSHNLS